MELAKARHEVEEDMASLRHWMEEVSDCSDEAITEVRQAVRQATASFTHGLSSLAEQAGRHKSCLARSAQALQGLRGEVQALERRCVAPPEAVAQGSSRSSFGLRSGRFRRTWRPPTRQPGSKTSSSPFASRSRRT